MRVTVAELKGICPMSMGNPTFEPCKGPRCMAWRWGRMPDNKVAFSYADRKALVEPERPEYVPASWLFVAYDDIEDTNAHWLEPDEEAMERRQGWCGLAGDADHA